MKKDIHPKYYPEAKVICACGNTWTTGSTEELIRTEMCNVCHPFFTGEQRIVDTAGQVDRFQRRLQKADDLAADQARREEEKRRKEESLFEFVGEDKGKAAPETAQAEPQPGEEQAPAEAKPKAKRASKPRTARSKAAGATDKAAKKPPKVEPEAEDAAATAAE